MVYKLKKYIREHEMFMDSLAKIYRFFALNSIKGSYHLNITWQGVFAKHCKIINHGKNNTVNIGKGCRLNHCKIQLFGDNNIVNIDSDCVGNELDLWVSDSSVVSIGHNTHFAGSIHIACIEGRSVTIGDRCLFSNDITFRTGDSHSILNDKGERINSAADIKIGNHVWIGHQVIVLKGAEIGDESIIGTRALVTGKEFGNNVILAGSPAKVIKTNVTWNPEIV